MLRTVILNRNGGCHATVPDEHAQQIVEFVPGVVIE
jgi:hypothetical protein